MPASDERESFYAKRSIIACLRSASSLLVSFLLGSRFSLMWSILLPASSAFLVSDDERRTQIIADLWREKYGEKRIYEWAIMGGSLDRREFLAWYPANVARWRVQRDWTISSDSLFAHSLRSDQSSDHNNRHGSRMAGGDARWSYRKSVKRKRRSGSRNAQQRAALNSAARNNPRRDN